MRSVKYGRTLAVTLYLLLVLAFAASIGWFALRDGLDRLEEGARADLSLASDQLTGQLQRYRELAVLLASHPTLTPLAAEGGSAVAANALLRKEADSTGSEEIMLLDQSGKVLASSVGSDLGSTDQAGTLYFRRAMQGTIGFHHGVEGANRQRIFLYAVPVFSEAGPVMGAIVIRLDAEKVEATSRGEAQNVFFTDTLGVVFVSNRGELLFGQREVRGPSASDVSYPAGLTHPFPAIVAHQFGRHSLWSIDAGPYLPSLALHLTQPLPVVDLTGEILLDATPTLHVAELQAATAAALCVIFGALLFVVAERRRALALRLATEARLTAQLERNVAARTRELSTAVDQLRDEVAERLEAEAALKKAQADLIRAGKLSALGQMSAGISHELNQPLMAIRSYAENGTAFIARGQPEIAGENLDRISDLARRMGRIIRNLRAFARQEVEGVSDVDLVGVIDAVLEITQTRMAHEEVTLDYTPPTSPVMVRGGEVRLQQVVLNLVSNALDAMAGRADRRLTLRIVAEGATTRLSVRDTGAGIAEPERMFDPFYSTKEVGQAEGMGLGLSISYAIIESFGGTIAGQNVEGGGAEFTVGLTAVQKSEAA
ncbi:MAG: sensor histidine kinase [Paracoccaceae bacterium]|nr:sensor histidine kinase [Paracoccaceae bacterium]